MNIIHVLDFFKQRSNPERSIGDCRTVLLSDPEYGRCDAEERECRRRHKNAAAIRAAKEKRLHELLQRPGAPHPSRATILNILGA